MATITLTIPDNKLSRIVDMFKGKFQIPKVNTGTPESPVWENEFTDNQWAKEKLRRTVIQWVHSYEKDEAEKELGILKDDSLIS